MTAKLYKPGDKIRLYPHDLLSVLKASEYGRDIFFNGKGWENTYTQEMWRKICNPGYVTIKRISEERGGEYHVDEMSQTVADEIIHGYYFQPGETILVSGNGKTDWAPRTFLAMNFFTSSPYCCLIEGTALHLTDINNNRCNCNWPYAKPMPKEHAVQLSLTIDGKPVSPGILNKMCTEIATLLRKETL